LFEYLFSFTMLLGYFIASICFDAVTPPRHATLRVLIIFADAFF